MDALDVNRTVRRIAREIAERVAPIGLAQDLAVVGIRRGGAHVALRVWRQLVAVLGVEPPFGTLDIRLYRDDGTQRGHEPVVGVADVRFPVDGRTLVLVDDVLHTGRTARAAIGELLSLGRPRQVWLAVLVDRGRRDLPLAPDFVGACVEVPEREDVQVRLREAGAFEDAVVLQRSGWPRSVL